MIAMLQWLLRKSVDNEFRGVTVSQKNYLGKLIAIDMYNCNIEDIKDPKVAEDILAKGCQETGMECRRIECLTEEGKEEYSLFALCKQGHVTLHIYPEMGFMVADMFSCCEGSQPAELCRYLRQAYDADKSKITLLDRGDFGSKNDMKPTHRSKTKLIRHTKNVTQNVGDKLKQVMLKPRSI